MKPGVAARRAAATAVGRILRSGAYSNRLIDASSLQGPDADLFRFLTYTTLRHLARIDAVLESNSNKSVASLDADVVDVLRVAVAELLYGRAPEHAIVDSAVESIKSGARRRASGFVNGVLRTVIRTGRGEVAVHDPRDEYPDWLVGQLDAEWPTQEVTAFLTASLGDAPRQVRARPGSDTDGLTPVVGIAGAFEWTDHGAVAGGFVVQDAASVAVGNAVPLAPGDLVLDMAAAPGGKAIHLLDRGARVVAADRHLRRVRDGNRRAPGLAWLVADGLAAPFKPDSFDHVLLDAPCSGLGTMRRRPEVRYRLDPGSASVMGVRQRLLLEAALSLVKPGGTVTYSVCTVTPEETVGVVAGLDAEAPSGTPGRAWGNGVLFGPHLTGTDGMFISVVRRS
ncbi:MAG: transcription antitermination factor NusB [Acidimicrobiia bacterium]|nr:transcription antitermination factor NusB [Acidimicrobiia bacterium]